MRQSLFYYKKLLEEAELLKEDGIRENGECLVEGLTFDSREAVKNGIFVCKGAGFQTAYLESARKKGCLCYISERRYETDGPMDCLLVKDIRHAMPVLARAFYERPEDSLMLTGITGTKGKTTTAYYLKGILDAYEKAEGRKSTGILSTIENFDGAESQYSRMTTPESMEIYRHLKNAADSGLDYMTMEVSSQALKYSRVRGLFYDVGIFLNISEDHISPREHEDFEDYFSSKLSLFRQTRTACVNLDSPCSDRILKAARLVGRVVTFGTTKAPDLWAHDIRMNQGRLSFRVKCDRFHERFTLAMRGNFNVENALGAIAAAYVYGIPVEYMKAGLENVRVSGRMEEYESSDGQIVAVVDYAHNRLSFERLFDTICLEYPGWRIVSVFGCPGGKGYNRRRDLGLIAGLFSNKVYLTADDPGLEKTDKISGEIRHYVEMVGCDCECIEDRGQAIRRAVSECKEKTVILVLGKGNEARQKYGNTVYHYPPDAQLVCQALRDNERRPYSWGAPSVAKAAE
ncbi:MAG: UDP-N-acetylmuramoyl-L-alanyl-D-glutamate--2,6-diaminopimelate ligase [Candidatus Limivivens sp.]|nr:UDP-N-acetylmuramoyl-L-alanyl-D-glutamate--2,6-diaminopimelate ligase [Candidatus Limivivens sp.]